MVRSVRRISEISGIDESELRSVFTFKNLLDYWPGYAEDGGSRFDPRAGSEAAERLRVKLRDERMILLGRRVERAFLGEFRQPWFEWIGQYAVAPHPSGISKVWNDPEIVARAATFWQEAYSREVAGDD